MSEGKPLQDINLLPGMVLRCVDTAGYGWWTVGKEYRVIEGGIFSDVESLFTAARATFTPIRCDWVIWNGGECPVPADTLGWVQLGSQTRVSAELAGEFSLKLWRWRKEGHGSDIIAFRCALPEAPSKPDHTAEIERLKSDSKAKWEAAMADLARAGELAREMNQ